MPRSSKLVFFGTEDFSLPSLKALFDAGYDIAAVVTKPDTKRGRGKQLVEPTVKTFAKANNIMVLQPRKLTEIEKELTKIDAGAGVLVSYGKILPQKILDIFETVGIVNIHPSLLPKYRGPAPIEAAIEHGDEMTGISIMKLTAGMDEGPIFVQNKYPLAGTETRPELTASLAEEGAKLLVESLPSILDGSLKPTKQKNSDVSYTSLISKPDGILDPATDDAYVIERKIRAHLGFPKSRIKIRNNDVILTAAKVVNEPSSKTLTITCSNNTYLEVCELIAPSGKSMSGADYLRGYSN